MDEMPRPRPPHLHRETSRHGSTAWYVRFGKGLRIRLRSDFGTDEFTVEYEAALQGVPRPINGNPATGTLVWLIGRYREVGAWTTLSRATRRQRENIFKQAIEKAGNQPATQITMQVIVAGCERRSNTPAQARHFLDAMRGLFGWATKAGLVKTDPTSGVENPQVRKGDGFPAWTEDDVERYQRRWPIGTRQRVWLDVLLYTGVRRGDAVLLGRQHIRDGVATLKTEKSGGTITVTLLILPVLAETLATGPCGDLTFITGERGQPLTKESFGNLFRAAARAAGVSKSAHGVRKIAAATASDNGATVPQLEAIFGWSGGRMASLYTRSSDRKRLALDAMSKLKNDDRTSIPLPPGQVRARTKKD